MRLLIPLLTGSLFLSACDPVNSNAGCSTLYKYTPEQQAQAADELDALPKGGIIERMIGDYGVVRNEIRACRGD